MRWTWTMIALAALGCKNEPAPDPFNPDVTAEVPSWLDDELAANTEACSTSPYWGEANMATTFFAGNYAFDGETVTGNEFWFLYPNDVLAENAGFEPCQVVWDVVGVMGDPVNTGTYSLSISAVIDEDQTDCVEDFEGNTVYGPSEEQFSVMYDVLDGGGNVTVLFANSGNQVGSGESTNNGISWISEKDCKIF